MADEEPAHKLAKLLDQASAEDRHAITAWLLQSATAPARRRGWMIRQFTVGEPAKIPGVLPAGEDSQLITVRLPQEQHAQLRAWCTAHNFTMAAVVRGLVERFLEEEGAVGDPRPESDPESEIEVRFEG